MPESMNYGRSDTTPAMIEAALREWHRDRLKPYQISDWDKMRAAIDAANAAARTEELANAG